MRLWAKVLGKKNVEEADGHEANEHAEEGALEGEQRGPGREVRGRGEPAEHGGREHQGRAEDALGEGHFDQGAGGHALQPCEGEEKGAAGGGAGGRGPQQPQQGPEAPGHREPPGDGPAQRGQQHRRAPTRRGRHPRRQQAVDPAQVGPHLRRERIGRAAPALPHRRPDRLQKRPAGVAPNTRHAHRRRAYGPGMGAK